MTSLRTKRHHQDASYSDLAEEDVAVGVAFDHDDCAFWLSAVEPVGPIRRPKHIDEASWNVVQCLLEQKSANARVDGSVDDNDHAIADDEVKPPSLRRQPVVRRRDSTMRFLGSRYPANEEEESASLALALQIHEEEAARDWLLRQQQEQSSTAGFALAVQLDEEERDAVERASAATRIRPPDNRRQLTKDQVLDTLEPCQLAALEYVQKQAASLHEQALGGLQERVQALGHTEEALQNVIEYIRNDAPIVIHLTQDTLKKLTNDTHYRNLFETQTSGGTNCTTRRMQWESTMFGPSYDGCLPSDRVKYGCLNVTGDISGVKAATRYGAIVMSLVPHIRYRTTFFSQDSAIADNQQLATNEYYAHVLADYADVELRSTLGLSRLGGARSRCTKYKEVQIHGPVCLATDVQSLSVPGTAADAATAGGLFDVVMAFQEQTKCNILWQGDFFEA